MFKRTFAVSLLVAVAMSARAQPAPTADDGTPVPTAAPAINALTPVGNAAGPLSLADALGIAAESNPLLRAAKSDADASVGTFIQAGVRPNPSISFLQEGFGGQERTTTALVNQTIELGGKRRTRLDVASYGREMAHASLDGRAAALRADVADAFYGLLAAQRQLKVAEESADIAARSADLADKRARAGKVSPVEATKARVAATGVQIELASARTRVTTAREKLVNVTGSAAARDRVVTGNLDDIPEAEPLSQLLQRLDASPVARAARAEMLRSNALVSVEKAKRTPDVNVSAGMKRVITGGRPDNQVVVGVSIPLPIFDTNKGAILEAVHKAAKADADFDGERARLQLELTQTYANYENSTQEAHRLKADVLPAARESLDAMSRGYELGKFSFLDVLDAQRTLFQGQSQYVQALTDAHRAYADLGRLSGSPLRSDLRPTANLP